MKTYTNIKEVTEMIETYRFGIIDAINTDFSLFVQYKDGRFYHLCNNGEDGIYKNTGIVKVLEINPRTSYVYGQYYSKKEIEKNEN